MTVCHPQISSLMLNEGTKMMIGHAQIDVKVTRSGLLKFGSRTMELQLLLK